MGMKALMKALKGNGDEVSLKASEGGILANLPYSVYWTAKGYGRQMMSTTAVAALVVRPGTTAAAVLFNNNTSGIHLVIERVFAHNLVTAVEENGGLWLCVHPVGMTAPGDDIATARSSTSGRAGVAGGTTQWGIDETVVADGWFPWGQSEWTNLDGTVPGGQLDAHVAGRIIIPPQAGLSMHVVGSTTANTYTIGAHWYEVPANELAVA